MTAGNLMEMGMAADMAPPAETPAASRKATAKAKPFGKRSEVRDAHDRFSN